MRVLVTGSNGLLGSEFVNFLQKNKIEFKTIQYSDLCKGFGFLKMVFEAFKPNFVFHCAANTNVELCEINKLDCYRDNVLITEKLCNLSHIFDAKFIFFSSTGIYGNEATDPYTEFNSPNPTTEHHKSKLMAEQRVQALTSRYLILRVGWLFGGNPNSKKNFVVNRINEFNRAEGDIQANDEQYGSPTYVLDVIDVVFRLINCGATGVFNCVGLGFSSRFEYVKEIADIVKFEHEVKPKSASYFNRVANVSNNEMAINEKLSSYGIALSVTWQQRLREYIEGIYDGKII